MKNKSLNTDLGCSQTLESAAEWLVALIGTDTGWVARRVAFEGAIYYNE